MSRKEERSNKKINSFSIILYYINVECIGGGEPNMGNLITRRRVIKEHFGIMTTIIIIYLITILLLYIISVECVPYPEEVEG
jgi:hypothetical protein